MYGQLYADVSLQQAPHAFQSSPPDSCAKLWRRNANCAWTIRTSLLRPQRSGLLSRRREQQSPVGGICTHMWPQASCAVVQSHSCKRGICCSAVTLHAAKRSRVTQHPSPRKKTYLQHDICDSCQGTSAVDHSRPLLTTDSLRPRAETLTVDTSLSGHPVIS
jgi:hypothetical protein